jgi:uncharacterized membrane protein (UPF0127 family)
MGGTRLVFLLVTASLLLACRNEALKLEDLNTRPVRLPNGVEIRAEVMMHPEDMIRGMMYRDSLPPDRGMLFIHGEPGQYTYWMYQVKIPLDIIWLDAQKRIVEMSPHTPPCTTRASECPHYGGNVKALYVLELAAGSIERHGLRIGSRLEF